MKTRQTNPFIQREYFMRQITTFHKNLRLPSKPKLRTLETFQHYRIIYSLIQNSLIVR